MTGDPADDPADDWLRFGLERHGRLQLVGFRDAAIPIELDRVFVPLFVYADHERRGRGPERRGSAAEAIDGDKRTLATGGAEIGFDEALAKAADGFTCLALIGDPGAGKTTLLRHLFRRVGLGEVGGRIGHLAGLHPVFVRLATVTDAELVPHGLEHIVARIAAEDGYAAAAPVVLARSPRQFLFLLDGLDEVRDEPTRERVCAWLLREVHHWSGCAFVVTSRRAAWTRTPALSGQFLPVSVQGLHGPAITEYVERWFRAVVAHFYGAVDRPDRVAARARAGADALLAVLDNATWRSSARLREMVANPLMLSTLCLAHYTDTRLPDQRGELYERTLGLLVEVWPREREGLPAARFDRDTRPGAGGPVLRLETARLVLQPLAYAMHEQDRRELSLDEATALVTDPLARVPAVKAVAPTAGKFLDLVRDECGVLMSRDLGRVEFVHLSFQEYLSACHVSTRGLGATLADRAGDPRWEEVVLLAMSRPGVFEPFMARALERSDVGEALLRQCLREALEIMPTPFEAAADRALARLLAPAGMLARFGRWVLGRPPPRPAVVELRRLFTLVQGHALPGMIERARRLVDHGDVELRAAARRVIGIEAAVEVGPHDRAPFVEPTTGIAFVWIPGGSFLMGSSKTTGAEGYDPDAYADEEPPHRVTLTGFWMSVYPVTNEQYTRFVAATDRAAPESFADRRFNDPAQPVVTVSWDDARAFATWLTEQLRGPRAGTAVRLPTEAEWEYAARGTDGRKYPWGNDAPDASRATFSQEGRSPQLAVVGATPAGASPLGVQDLAGNVLEWCLDDWADSYAEIKAGSLDPCHHGDPRGGSRVVRGGSWCDVPRSLRSAYRSRLDPQARIDDLGFRVVCGGSRQPVSD